MCVECGVNGRLLGPFCNTATSSPHKAHAYEIYMCCICVSQIARMKFPVVWCERMNVANTWPLYLTRSAVLAHCQSLLALFRVLIDVWRKSFMPHIQMIMLLWSKHLPNNHHNDTVCNSNIHVFIAYMRLNIIRTHTQHTAHTLKRMLSSANNTIVTKILHLQHTHTIFYDVSSCIPFHTQYKRTKETQRRWQWRRRKRKERLRKSFSHAHTFVTTNKTGNNGYENLRENHSHV